MRIVCSAGGTGGHIFPAVAVAQSVKKRYPDAQILFIGARGKMEMKKVPKAGFPIKGLWISGLQRRLTWSNIIFPLKVIVSLISAFVILRKFRPDVVAGFGGYASGAAVWVASRMKIPTLILEQNSYAGLANKLLNGSADIVCLAYDEARKYFSKGQIIMTGNPIRAQLKSPFDQSTCKSMLELEPDKRTVLIIGGSLGARSINEALAQAAEEIDNLNDIQIYWQCGSAYYDQYANSRTAALEHVHLTEFIDDMSLAYGAADLVVCRAGAISIAEIIHLEKAAILVPSPNVAEDHQTKNAKVLEEKGAAILLSNEQLDKLIPLITETIEDRSLMDQLSTRVKAMDRPMAEERIVDAMEELSAQNKQS